MRQTPNWGVSGCRGLKTHPKRSEISFIWTRSRFRVMLILKKAFSVRVNRTLKLILTDRFEEAEGRNPLWFSSFKAAKCVNTPVCYGEADKLKVYGTIAGYKDKLMFHSQGKPITESKTFFPQIVAWFPMSRQVCLIFHLFSLINPVYM